MCIELLRFNLCMNQEAKTIAPITYSPIVSSHRCDLDIIVLFLDPGNRIYSWHKQVKEDASFDENRQIVALKP